jgi:hypothetical protein
LLKNTKKRNFKSERKQASRFTATKPFYHLKAFHYFDSALEEDIYDR